MYSILDYFIRHSLTTNGNVMAEKKLKLDDFKKKVTPLSILEMKQTSGGYNQVSPGAGSIGQIQWDEIDFRNLNENEKPAFGGTILHRPSRGISKK